MPAVDYLIMPPRVTLHHAKLIITACIDDWWTSADDDNSNSAPFLNYSQVAINAEISEEFAYHR